MRRAFSLFTSLHLRRKVNDPTIPMLSDLLEVRNMLGDRRQEWWEMWLDEGKREGEARLLRRQLERRFGPLPPSVKERLAKASEAELVCWADRMLDATLSLEQLLSSGSAVRPLTE